jgi:putative nucleotidyltransferase with HDIG domain
MEEERRETVLIVDDEESILGVVGEYFRRRGYPILTARGGAEALDLLDQHAVDCCFTDINMPGMNGLELAERIHRSDNTLPVIVMTGYPSLEASIRTLKNGVVDFLIKPVNLKSMELSLRRVMRQRALFVENLLLKQEVRGKQRIEELNRELVEKVDELNTLNRIMGDIAGTSSSAHVFQRSVDLALEVVGADRAGFWVIGGSDGRLLQVAGAVRRPTPPSTPDSGPESPQTDAAVEAALQRHVREVAAEGRPVLVSQGPGARGLPEQVGSFMAVPVHIRGRAFGVLTAAAAPGGRVFAEKDLFYLSYTIQSAANAIETLVLYENIYENLFATLYGFVNALEARDLYTRQHSSRVTEIALLLGRELGCSAEELNVLNFAGPLHDIGKIGIRDDILLKPGRLSPQEFEKIKEHPVIGANMLNQLGIWEQERRIIRCHHERFDGSGYPDGLSAEQIPFLARILSVADAYDAMASDRAYRKRMEEALILDILRKGAGTQFDPRIVAVFEELHRTRSLGPNAPASA